MVSPLAEGADRLAAKAALAIGYQLFVILPFPAEEYAQDFPASVVEFEALLARADGGVRTLPGVRGEAEAASYEAVGHAVVAACDVLIAIWDGLPARGRGGTAEIVSHALKLGRPVCWLLPDGSAPPAWRHAGDADWR